MDKDKFNNLELNDNFENSALNLLSEFSTDKEQLDFDIMIEKLNRIYKYICLNEYFSVALDLVNDENYFKSKYDEIEKNLSDEEEKNRAKQAIKNLENRTKEMNNNKKNVIIEIIKNNILERQIIKFDVIKNQINNNITKHTTFGDLRKITFMNLAINNITENFDQDYLLSGYDYNDNKYFL
jgi:hypothetical protein